MLGGYINGLGLVRALAANGIPTAVIRTQPFDIAHHSRHVCAHETALELAEHPELLVELLVRRADNWPGWALFPTNDETLAVLARHQDQLGSKYRIIAPTWEAACHLLDKNLMHKTAQAVGMDVPHYYGLAEATTAARPELRFPVVVKPVSGHRFFARFGCKLFVAHDRGELTRCVGRIRDANVPCSVFDFIPGADDRIYVYCVYMDDRGNPSAGLTVRKLRQSPPLFGVARVAEVVEGHAALREASIELLRRIGFRGMAMVEFKLDPRDGTFWFIEVNGRSVVYNALLRRAGLDLAALAWSDYMGGRLETARPNGWPGVWVNLHADVLYSAFYRHYDRIGFRDFIAPYRRPKIEAVWSARDPFPFLAQWSRTAWEGAIALWRGTLGERLADRARPAPDAF